MVTVSGAEEAVRMFSVFEDRVQAIAADVVVEAAKDIEGEENATPGYLLGLFNQTVSRNFNEKISDLIIK